MLLTMLPKPGMNRCAACRSQACLSRLSYCETVEDCGEVAGAALAGTAVGAATGAVAAGRGAAGVGTDLGVSCRFAGCADGAGDAALVPGGAGATDAAAAGACPRAKSAAALTGTSPIVTCRSASLATIWPPIVICSWFGRAVRIIGPLASAGTV